MQIARLLLCLALARTAMAADIDLPDVSLAAETTTAETPVPKAGDFQVFDGRVGTVACARWEVAAADEGMTSAERQQVAETIGIAR